MYFGDYRGLTILNFEGETCDDYVRIKLNLFLLSEGAGNSFPLDEWEEDLCPCNESPPRLEEGLVEKWKNSKQVLKNMMAAEPSKHSSNWIRVVKDTSHLTIKHVCVDGRVADSVVGTNVMMVCCGITHWINPNAIRVPLAS